MCGIFGWSLSPNTKPRSIRTIAATLLTLNDTRGGNSWGYYAPRSDSRVTGMGNASGMTKSNFNKLIKEPVLHGHTRKATTGTVTLDNCHPFDYDPIVGMHNGIVFNHDELNAYYDRSCSVDSEHLFLHIKEDITLVDIEAYGAITYYNRETPDVDAYLLVFDGELSIVETEIGWLWSSSWVHLESVLNFSGIGSRDDIEVLNDYLLYALKGGVLYEMGKKKVGKPHYQLSPNVYRQTGTNIPTHLTDDDLQGNF